MRSLSVWPRGGTLHRGEGSTLRHPAHALLGCIALAGSLMMCQTASAAPHELQLLPPGMDSKGIIFVNGSRVLRHLDFSLGLVLGYTHRPLSLQGDLGATPWCALADNTNTHCGPTSAEVRHLATSNLQLALGLFDHVEVGIGLPLLLWSGSANTATGGIEQGIEAQGIGDITVGVKGRLLNASDRLLGLSLILSLALPTGDPARLLGAGGAVLAPTVIVDRELMAGRIHLALNLGTRFGLGPGSAHHLTFGAGAALGLVPRRLELVGEVLGRAYLSGAPDDRLPGVAAQTVAGFKLYLAHSSHLHLALGRGLRGGGDNYAPGSPDLSVLLGFIFEPAIGDRDGDGLKDDADRCPDEPEDLDDFEDTDGCPDPDNDRDGVLDQDDQCPEIPEDIDGVEDQDGCPDADLVDRDGDGLRDDVDRCPDEPEDMDQFEDADGCPDPDNDQDQILDIDDLCPLRPESYNRFEDQDGCPDERPRIKVTPQVLVPLEKIYFETDRAVIQRVSYKTLDAVVWALETHTNIQLLEIQGHADERGSRVHNQQLTDRRAHAVRTYLVVKGIAPGRLIARGYGEDRPLQRGSTPQSWSRNRRVEFVIVERAAGDSPSSP